MVLSDSILPEEDKQEKLLEKFDETLKSLRRQFRKLLKERKAHKNCKILNQSEGNGSTCSTKTNDSIKELKDAAELVSENKNISDDISIIESNNVTNLTSDIVDNQKIAKDNPPLHEELEILSVQFDTESEQSLLKQFEESKLKINPKESQLQKSPVFSRNKIREKKKNFSCKIFPTSERKSLSAKEQITENPKSAQENVASNISLFSSPREKDLFISPKVKSNQKLGVSNLYNVSSKQSTKGNKLKQTKLVFLADEEKVDISEKTDMKIKEEKDSIFDMSLFNSNINVENMEVDMDDTFPNSKTTNIETTLGSSTPKAGNKTNFDKISPTKENKEVGEGKIKVKKMFSLMNFNTSEPQATTTTFLSPRKQETKIVHHSDSDTDFSFQDDYLLNKQSSQSGKKNLVGFVKKASVLKESSHKDYNQINKIHHNETMLDDETFFSPGEYQNDAIKKTPTKAGTSRETYNSPKNKRLPMKSFDKNPEKKKRSPEYAYNIQSVRRKNERAQLDGWSCWDCKKYYQGLDLSEKELKECMKKCSRHKAKYDPNYYTPPGFWNPAFPDTLCPTLPEQEK
ncbi:DNA endonuclease RBBP8-like [Leptopilina heterotoma]|uniref:DNA endonuclease RBBP8-like n=1 Tax=Leptopilina heterotoma TaxID=63436 RepID=UPI001CA85700|nr:DNA endonuclease RBBP8-like [Leptopilina heterotoma]